MGPLAVIAAPTDFVAIEVDRVFLILEDEEA